MYLWNQGIVIKLFTAKWQPIVVANACASVHDLGHTVHITDALIVGIIWNTYIKFVCVFSCVWLCDPMDCSVPGSSVHGIFQARILELPFPTPVY